MKWIEIKVNTTLEAEEAIANIMHELGAGGVVINDPNDIITMENEGNWDYMDPNLLIDSKDVIISAYFPIVSDILDKINIIKDRILELKNYNIDIGKFDFKISEVDESDWENSWKQYYKPIKIGSKIIIKPSWEKYVFTEGELVIELDPGMAFGTGTHETTKMSIEFLEMIIKQDYIVFDVGCGSGILSIVSAKLGAKEVFASDVDEVAIKVTKENIKLNNLKNIQVFKSNLLDNFEGKADVIVANIIADVIIKMSSVIPDYLKENGYFIASGIIKDRKNEVLNVLNSNFNIIDLKQDGEWISILGKRK
ncbi:MAG: 50S ribosomal protein L11 methyltransferase [Thermoanaerobacteraceae bacterium]